MKADGLFVCFFCLPNLLSAYIQFILQHKPCVGDGALDVPLLVCLSNSTLSAQRSAYFFKTLYGTTFPHTARLHKFMNNQTLPLRAGCRGRQPLQFLLIDYSSAKSLRSLRIYIALRDRKAVQILYSDITFI